MSKESKTVQEKVRELYAVLASAAAQRAVDKVKNCSNPFDANLFVDAAVEWLNKAGARAANWTYRRPS